MATLTLPKAKPQLLVSPYKVFTPKKDFVLISGHIEIFGIPFFYGSIVYNEDEGIKFENEIQLFGADKVLDSKITTSLKGDYPQIAHIKKTRSTNDLDGVKWDYEVTQIEVTQDEILKAINEKHDEIQGVINA